MLYPHSPSPVVNQGYTPKVGFDTFENPQASMFSYTLHVQNEGYSRNKNTRVFLCAASPDESGSQALDWVLENLVQDGDELIVFRGADSDDLSECFHTLGRLACGGCNVFHLSSAPTDKEQDVYREEARELMRQVQDKCSELPCLVTLDTPATAVYRQFCWSSSNNQSDMTLDISGYHTTISGMRAV